MKGKQLASLLGLVAVVGGAGYFLQKDNVNSWRNSGTATAGGKVLNLSLNDVARVTVKATGAELNLVKKDDVWTVQERANYPANFEQVSGLIRKTWDLKTVQDVKVGASQFARMELVEPGKGEGSGTVLQFQDKEGKDLGGLLLGKKQMRKGEDGMEMFGGGGSAVGRHVMPLGSTKVSLVSESFDDVNTKAESWLQRDFFKVENVASVTLAGATDAQKWKVSRENTTSDWKLDGAKPEESLDAGKVNPIATAFGFANFTDVLAPDAKPEETGLDKPSIVTFETTDKFTYVVKVGKANGENYPITVAISAALPKERTPGKDEKPEDKTKLDADFTAAQKKLDEKLVKEKKFEARAYFVSKGTIDQLLKDRSALLAEKKPDAPATPEGASATPPTPGLVAPQPPKPKPAPSPISVTTPPVTVPPITATTPPVAAPPSPAKPATPENKPAGGN